MPNPYRDAVSEVSEVYRKDWEVPNHYRDAVSEVSGVYRKDWEVPNPYRGSVSEASGVCRLLSHRHLPLSSLPRQTPETSETASLSGFGTSQSFR